MTQISNPALRLAILFGLALIAYICTLAMPSESLGDFAWLLVLAASKAAGFAAVFALARLYRAWIENDNTEN